MMEGDEDLPIIPIELCVLHMIRGAPPASPSPPPFTMTSAEEDPSKAKKAKLNGSQR